VLSSSSAVHSFTDEMKLSSPVLYFGAGAFIQQGMDGEIGSQCGKKSKHVTTNSQNKI
jgi:hypothetical protein